MEPPDCKKCGLLSKENQPVPDDGGDYTILACGESPGLEEVRQGKPFVGKSGQLLRDALRQLGYPLDQVTYTNIVRCHPPDNETKPLHVKCCYRSLPIKENTRLVLLLGNIPLKAVLGESGITTWNGVRVERDGIIYAPILHPAYLLHRQSRETMDAWLEALDGALIALDNGPSDAADSDYVYSYPEEPEEIREMISELAESEIISFDTEFSSLDAFKPGNKINVVSFANDRKAWALQIDYPKSLPPDPHTIPLIKRLLEKHPCIIGHNIKMDQLQVDACLGIKFDAAGDTMLASFLVATETGLHSLKRLAGFYLGMFEYDSELKDYVKLHPECDPTQGGSYANVPPSILLPYAARDAAATFLLEPILLEKLTEKQKALYLELRVPASNALYRMTYNGMAVDHEIADRYRRIYNAAIQEIHAAILEDKYVVRYIRERRAGLSGKKADSFFFNPRSSVQRADVLYGKEYYNLKPLGFTPKEKPSTAQDFIKPYADRCPLVKMLVDSSTLSKMISTYIHPIALGTRLSGDGRARSSFNQHIAVTGRLSSSSFSKKPPLGINQQNIPNPDRVEGTILEYQPIRSMFTHTWEGGCFLSIDYSGMEIRVLACLSRCQPLLDYIERGEDVHTMVASMIYGVPPESVTKHQRTMAKSVTFALQYGGTAYTIAQDTGIPMEEAEEIVRRYFRAFPEVKEYMDECIQFAQQNGYIENPFGLRRYLADILSADFGKRARAEREAVNTPVQGGAGMLTELAVAIIDMLMQERGFRSMLVNTVHDSIATDVYPGELENIIDLQVDVMENLPHFAKQYAPSIDLSWIICPLSVDVEVGSHYGTLEPYVKEESNASSG